MRAHETKGAGPCQTLLLIEVLVLFGDSHMIILLFYALTRVRQLECTTEGVNGMWAVTRRVHPWLHPLAIA